MFTYQVSKEHIRTVTESRYDLDHEVHRSVPAFKS